MGSSARMLVFGELPLIYITHLRTCHPITWIVTLASPEETVESQGVTRLVTEYKAALMIQATLP